MQISLDDDFDDTIKDAKTMTPSFVMNKEGIFYFRVATIDGWGKWESLVKKDRLKLILLPRLKNSPRWKGPNFSPSKRPLKRKGRKKIALLEMLKQKQKMAADAIAETVKKE